MILIKRTFFYFKSLDLSRRTNVFIPAYEFSAINWIFKQLTFADVLLTLNEIFCIFIWVRLENFFFDKIEKLQFFPFKSKRRQNKNWLTDKHVSSTFNENSFSRCTLAKKLQHRMVKKMHNQKKSLNFPISGNQQKKTRIFDLAGLKYFQYRSEVETEKKTFFEISRESLDKY